ncbi:hypothetical protein DID88_000823 [Monilinia fructigena]|uniref:Zn(2)-C6 fungal-type domain-containing protein n=1 Tax=Monilinia fructigena TaxID=38457 RepID=A0A395IIL1_9HELO|nr:hypothetical protein DID88_000823 [Monilinia fructigena]
MSSNLDFSSEGLLDLTFEQRDPRYQYTNMATRSTWPLPLDMGSGGSDERRETSPVHSGHQQYQTGHHHNSPTLLTDWPIQQQPQHLSPQQLSPQQLSQFIPDNTLMGPQYTFGSPYQTSPLDYGLPATTQAALEASLQMEAPFNGLAQTVEAQANQWQDWHEFDCPSPNHSSFLLEIDRALNFYPPFPSNTSSPPARRNPAPRKSPHRQGYQARYPRRTSNGKKDATTEKRVGRRRGPLLPEQRKQASEIRKLRACLRCKFLKKTCDKGEPCAGCQPSHARLWQVPCTRIDIKDIGYFMKDWKADYERHVDRGVSVYNIKGFAQKEELLWITHGYGFALPIMAREVYVSDDSCFNVDWVEGDHEEPLEFETRTERINIDGPFEEFIDKYFQGTLFITDILKTAHRYYVKEKVSVVRKALKLVLAYNLTLHITMVEKQGDEHPMEGIIEDEDSKFNGKIVAPVMINFQIKCALADMWRELQKEILEELSSLYSSVYSGDRLKNWPTIFMLASILLAIWEEMQFDCHYRVPDQAAVNKILQRHGNHPSWRHLCEAMTEMRGHITKHESYLKTRPDAKFDRRNFELFLQQIPLQTRHSRQLIMSRRQHFSIHHA